MGIHDTSGELSDHDFSKLKSIIHRNTGITIADGRKTMVLSRLRGRLREIGEPSFKGYIKLLGSDPKELQELIDRMTTNKTHFYRTGRIWEHFTDEVVPAFQARHVKRPMRVWSGASSTGQEAHTIGVLLEDVRARDKGFDYSVLGTDVSMRVLKQAEEGLYDRGTLKPLIEAKPDLFETYFAGKDDTGYKVQAQIKARLKFKRHNLLERLKNTSPFDVVFLRNVLIYFTNEDQEAILRNVRALMPPEGVLYIGESETLTRLDTDFDIIDPMIYQPKSDAPRVP